MRQTYDLTKGNPTKLILNFFFPMLFTGMLQQLYNLADTIVIGKGLGDNALAAVGNMSSLTFFIIGFSGGLTNGFSVIIAQRYGAGDEKMLRKSIASAATVSVAISLILTCFSVTFLRDILVLLQTDELILGDSLKYGYVIFGGLITTVAYNLCASILRALGDSRTPFVAIVVSAIINVVFNIVAIFVFKSGVEGPAIVTIAAQIISTLICLRRLSKIDIVKLSKDDFKNNGSIYSILLKNGIPMAIMNSITAIGCMVVQFFVNGLGVEYTSAYSCCSKYLNLFMQPASTAGMAMSAFTSQNYGAKKPKRILEGLKVCLSISLVSYLLLGSLMVFMPRLLAGTMLNGSDQIALAVSFLRKCGIMIFAVDFLFVIRSGCQGMGKPMLPMLSGLVEMILRIAVIVLFIPVIGFDSTAYAEIAAWCGALIINTFAFTYYLKKELRITPSEEEAN